MADLNKLSTTKNNDHTWLSLKTTPTLDSTIILGHEGQQAVSEPMPMVSVRTSNLNTKSNSSTAAAAAAATTIPPPFPWATDRRATVHSVSYLLTNGITLVTGEVQCKRCEHRDEISFDLVSKFAEVRGFVLTQYHEMHDRAPPHWLNPVFGTCGECGEKNCMKPVVGEKKRGINWLFLFLGQMLGICTLKQLKYLCKHTQNHRTGAKDRVLFLAYIAICKQLDPDVSTFLINKD